VTAVARTAGLGALLALVVGIPTLILCVLLAAVIGPLALIPAGFIVWAICRRVAQARRRELVRLGRRR